MDCIKIEKQSFNFLSQFSRILLIGALLFNTPLVCKAQDEENILVIRAAYRSLFETLPADVDMDLLLLRMSSGKSPFEIPSGFPMSSDSLAAQLAALKKLIIEIFPDPREMEKQIADELMEIQESRSRLQTKQDTSVKIALQKSRFPELSNFLKAVDERAPGGVDLNAFSVFNPGTPELMRQLVQNPQTPNLWVPILESWSRFIPVDMVSQSDFAEWRRLRQEQEAQLTKEVFDYRFALIIGTAYRLLDEPISLLGLYEEFPIFNASGHENLANLQIQDEVQTIFVKTQGRQEEHLRAFETIMRDRHSPSDTALHHWIRSPYKNPEQRMVSVVLEMGQGEALLEEYRDRPDQQAQILAWMRDDEYLKLRKRDLLATLKMRVDWGVPRDTLDRCVKVFGNTLVQELTDMKP